MSTKALLVIDMPKSCADCKLSDFGRCWGTYSYVHMRSDDIPVNCPLKPMPQKLEVEVNEIEDLMHTEYSIEDIYTNKYVATIRLATDKLISLGWNACLEEIEK